MHVNHATWPCNLRISNSEHETSLTIGSGGMPNLSRKAGFEVEVDQKYKRVWMNFYTVKKSDPFISLNWSILQFAVLFGFNSAATHSSFRRIDKIELLVIILFNEIDKTVYCLAKLGNGIYMNKLNVKNSIFEK